MNETRRDLMNAQIFSLVHAIERHPAIGNVAGLREAKDRVYLAWRFFQPYEGMNQDVELLRQHMGEL
ncbi:hypothetical protein FJZ17_02315 [Candidatus Pacearchaeota archaeon]|nr:hypothetical protein [Candidatus Pacearchaeota archaeon]